MTKRVGTDTPLVIIKVNEKYLAIDTELNTYTEVIRATDVEEGKWWDMIWAGEIVPEPTESCGSKFLANLDANARLALSYMRSHPIKE